VIWEVTENCECREAGSSIHIYWAEKHKAQDLTIIDYFAEEVDDEKSVKTGDVVCAGRCWV